MQTFVLLLLLAGLSRPAAALDLQTILSNMDRAAAGFKTMTARISRVKYTALLEEKSIETGLIAVRLEKNNKVRMLIDFREPYPYFLMVNGDKAEIYRPKPATVEEFNLSKHRDMFNQIFRLGFGTTGKFLSENYEVRLTGEEEAAGGPAVKLELVPKSEKLRGDIPRLDMWVSKQTWQCVQQKLYEQNPGDYRLFTYTGIVLNSKLPDKALRVKIPKKVKRTRH